MTHEAATAPITRKPTIADLGRALSLGAADFLRHPVQDMLFASLFVLAGFGMAFITYATGHTFWLILLVLGFPLIGTLAVVGFYEISRRSGAQAPVTLGVIWGAVWSKRSGQLPWLSVIIIVAFLFWFFLGHMIFALFLGLAPMTNISSSLEVFLTGQGILMLLFGTAVGFVFALFVFAISVLGLPMLLDRDVDFVTAMLASIAAVRAGFVVYLMWAALIATLTVLALAPAFLGLFIVMPVLGHASWHLYLLVSGEPRPQ